MPTRADVEHYLRELAGERGGDGRARGALRGADRARRCAAPASTGRCSARSARERLIAALRRRAASDRAGAARGFVRALGELFAELRVRRVTPARLRGALARWLAPTDRRALALRSSARAVRRVPRARSSGSGASTASSARCARWTRCGERPALWGRTPVAVLRLRRPHAAAARRDRDARARGRARRSRCRWPTSRARRVRRARGERFTTLLAARRRASRAAAARRALRAARRALALSHLERSLFEPARRARGRRWSRAPAARAAASAPSSSWSPARSALLLDAAPRPRRSRVLMRPPGTERGAARGGASRPPAIPSRPAAPTAVRRHGVGARADRAAALRAGAGRRARRRARRPARLAARAGLARERRARRRARGRARAGWARASAEQARGAVGAASLAAGRDRPAR